MYGCTDGNQVTSPINNPNYTEILLMCIFTMSTLLLPSIAKLFIDRAFLWLQQQGKKTKAIYTATAIVTTCVNILTFVSDIYFSATQPQIGITHFFIIQACRSLTVLMELSMAWSSTKEPLHNYGVLYRCAHTIAVLQIILFAHRLVIDVIISVVFFVIAPAQTIGFVTLLLSVIAIIVTFLAIFVNKGYVGWKTSSTSMLYVGINGILIVALLCVISLMYIIFVDNGLKSAGVGGLILSLIPPLSVFVIGIFVNQERVRSILIATCLGGGQNTSTNNSVNSEADNGERQPLLAPRSGH